jgi:hypothetical protein
MVVGTERPGLRDTGSADGSAPRSGRRLGSRKSGRCLETSSGSSNSSTRTRNRGRLPAAACLLAPDGRPVPEFLLHIQGAEAWWRDLGDFVPISGARAGRLGSIEFTHADPA